MKQIETLVLDIYNLVSSKSGTLGTETLGVLVAEAVERRLHKQENQESGSYLRPSNLGKPCERQLWYSINKPEFSEPLPPDAELKFLFGDILEALLLYLAEAAGHTVTGRQDEVNLFGVTGHRDCIIDGMVVDCKSASSYAFQKFTNHLSPDLDSFGYLTQLQFYLDASKDDPLVTVKDKAAFLVIDKTLGKIHLDIHQFKPKNWQKIIEEKQRLVEKDKPPFRGFQPEPKGKSGNMGLGTACSYCPFKNLCYPELRTFLYSTGPEFLTTVKRTPNVPEVK